MSTHVRAAALALVVVVGLGPSGSVDAQPAAARYQSPATELGALSALVGEWDLTLRQFSQAKNAWVPVVAERSVVDLMLGGRFVRQSITIRNGQGALRTDFLWSYDRFQQRYRMAALDDFVGLLDSFEGTKDGSRIVVNNVRANTYWAFPPREQDHVLAEVSLDIVDSNHIRVGQRVTTDAGRTWAPLYEGEGRRARNADGGRP